MGWTQPLQHSGKEEEGRGDGCLAADAAQPFSARSVRLAEAAFVAAPAEGEEMPKSIRHQPVMREMA